MEKHKKSLEQLYGEMPQSGWNNSVSSWKLNRGWIQNAQKIALEILDVLDQRKMSQKALATDLGVSAQQVSKWLSGKENFTLETISNFEKILKIKLIEVLDSSKSQVSQSTSVPTITDSYDSELTNRVRCEDIKREAKVIPMKPQIYKEYYAAEGQ